MPCIGGEQSSGNGQFSEGREGVLWIGRICQQKRPDLLLDMARKCPDLKFDLVGPFGTDEYAKYIFANTKNFSNITVHGAIKPDEVPGFYRKAKVMCCTSDAEGFPNSFLEAWSCGLPIVSTFDPDSLIRDRKLGIVCSNVDELEAGIRLLLKNPQQLSELSKTVRQYYLENHTVDAVMTLFEKEFLSFSE